MARRNNEERERIQEQALALLRQSAHDFNTWRAEEHPSDEINLSGADLSGLLLVDVDLAGCILIDADMRNSNLERADLSGANLCRSNLYSACLVESDLQGTRLINACLQDANLSYSIFARPCADARTDLSGANLGGCNFAGTNLSRTITTGADLEAAEGVRREDILEHHVMRAWMEAQRCGEYLFPGSLGVFRRDFLRDMVFTAMQDHI